MFEGRTETSHRPARRPKNCHGVLSLDSGADLPEDLRRDGYACNHAPVVFEQHYFNPFERGDENRRDSTGANRQKKPRTLLLLFVRGVLQWQNR